MNDMLIFPTFQAAAKALKQMNSDTPDPSDQFVVRIERSPYKGWRISRYPVDLYIDELADGRNRFRRSAGW
jgi:hypothetical protein